MAIEATHDTDDLWNFCAGSSSAALPSDTSASIVSPPTLDATACFPFRRSQKSTSAYVNSALRYGSISEGPFRRGFQPRGSVLCDSTKPGARSTDGARRGLQQALGTCDQVCNLVKRHCHGTVGAGANVKPGNVPIQETSRELSSRMGAFSKTIQRSEIRDLDHIAGMDLLKSPGALGTAREAITVEDLTVPIRRPFAKLAPNDQEG